jgi:AcrR family transcriptional regulator
MSETRNQRGRPPTTDVGRILDVSIELLDEVGVDGFTIRLLADRVGISPMTIYRHVADKASLLALLPDVLIAPVAQKVIRRRTALGALTEVADGLVGCFSTHAFAVRLFEQPVQGPNMILAVDHCVKLLVDAGVTPRESFALLRAVVAQVVGEFLTSHDGFDRTGVVLLLRAASDRMN